MADIMPFRDPALPIERRVEDLLGRMTLEEKVGQLMQYDGRQDGVAELAAAGKVGSILCVLGEAQVTAPAKAALGSRLGIPLLVGIDAIHGHSSWYNATIFPTQLALSHSWDEGICERVARATAVEMGSTGAHWNFAPLFCLPRDLRWGRTGETSGEDGLLIGKLGAAMVRGLQGDDLRRRDCVAACAKHYAGYGESEGGRDASESDHSRRKLRWLFLPPFREAVKAGCTTFMTAYHAIDGVPAAYHRWLLTDVLRGEWGFDGMVVTDWDIVGRKVRDRRIAATYAESSARTLNAGNDLIMTTPQFYDATLANLTSGAVTLAAVDQAVLRVLALKFRLGLFEDPRLPDDRAAAAAVATPAHRQLALESARASLVLLRNRNGLLPLAGERLRRVAVVGPNADDDLEQLGDWSLGAGQGQGTMQKHARASTSTVLDGLRAALPQAQIVHARGCNADFKDPGADRIPAAVRAAEGADVCVLVLGDAIAYIGEGKSTATLDLPGAQRQLFEAVAATGVPIVVVLLCSKPLAIPYIERRADAILLAHNPGMAGGTAIAEALLGAFNPSGRLTISWPHHVGQQPVRYDQFPGAHFWGYPDLPGVEGATPVFCFGEGLSYTTFRYEALRLQAKTLAKGEPLRCTLRVSNTGERAGTETVQLYVRDLHTSVTWPAKRLKAWKRVTLASGAAAEVAFELPYDDLALCDAEGDWVVEPGEFELIVACSSHEPRWGGNCLKAAFSVAG